MARALDPSGRGQLAFLMVVASLIGQLCEAGGEQAAMRMRQIGSPLNPFRQPLVRISLLVSAAVSAVVVLLAGEDALPAALTGLLAASTVASRFVLGVLTSDGRHARVAVFRSVPSLALALSATVVLLTHAHGQVFIISTSMVVYSSASLAVVFLAFLSQSQSDKTQRAAHNPGPRAEILTIQAGNAGVLLLYRFDQVILGLVATDAELGIYAVAVNFAEALQYVPVVGATLILTGKADRRRVWFICVLSIACTGAAVISIGPSLLTVMYGSGYESASKLLMPLVLGGATLAVARLFWSEMIAANRASRYAACTGGAAVFSAPLVVLASLRAGAEGAAYATLASYFLVLLLSVGLRVRRQDGRKYE